METKLQKIYLTYHSLLIPQDLWQAHYQLNSDTAVVYNMGLLAHFASWGIFGLKGISTF